MAERRGDHLFFLDSAILVRICEKAGFAASAWLADGYVAFCRCAIS
jgi:hypothetical protein